MASLRHTEKVTMHSPASGRTRFGNIAISITTFALGLLLSSSGHAQSVAQATVTQQGSASSDSKDAIRLAAWEQPQLFSEEIRAAFRSLR